MGPDSGSSDPPAFRTGLTSWGVTDVMYGYAYDARPRQWFLEGERLHAAKPTLPTGAQAFHGVNVGWFPMCVPTASAFLPRLMTHGKHLLTQRHPLVATRYLWQTAIPEIGADGNAHNFPCPLRCKALMLPRTSLIGKCACFVTFVLVCSGRAGHSAVRAVRGIRGCDRLRYQRQGHLEVPFAAERRQDRRRLRGPRRRDPAHARRSWNGLVCEHAL
eukprot:SAG22_NODE_1245_length_5020_cov_1.424304_6_plen_217_part_00